MGLVRNRVMRRRLTLTLVAVVGFLAVHVITWYLTPADPVAAPGFPQGPVIERLLVIFAFINTAVTLLLNPWFSDRLYDRAPAIVQDALVVAIFAGVGFFGLDEQAWMTSTAVAAVLGFASQETLSNAFAGLAIQMDRPFRVGHWVRLNDFEGQVVQVTWRATKIRTKSGDMVILPNSVVAREPISNFSEPAVPSRTFVEVGIDYGVPPNAVKDALTAAMAQVSDILLSPAPDVVLKDFGDSAIVYRARFWIDRFELDEVIRHRVRAAIYYELHRRGIEIPWPIRVLYNREVPAVDLEAQRAGYAAAIASVPVLAPLGAEAHLALAAKARARLYANGEVIVREGDAGRSMFLVRRGQVAVTIGPNRQEVAVTSAGGFFGEMSLLTGAPRSATVIAREDSELLEIDADTFSAFVRNQPEVIDEIAVLADARRRTLDESRATLETRAEARVSLAARMKQFLGL